MIWDQWRCTAINSRTRKPIRGEVFVRAKSRTCAEKCGERALRLHGITGRIRVHVTPYYPWLDRAFGRFIGEAK